MRTVFLQDANSLVMKTADLVRCCVTLTAVPFIERVTSYARARPSAKKSPDELHELGPPALPALQIGMESGDKVLGIISKG
jgi:hypothetical protein